MRKRLLKAIAKRIFISEGSIGSSAFNSRLNCGSLKELYDEGFPSANLTDEEIDKIDYLNDNCICVLTNPCEENMGSDFIYIKQFNGTIKYRGTYAFEDWTYDSEDTNENR